MYKKQFVLILFTDLGTLATVPKFMFNFNNKPSFMQLDLITDWVDWIGLSFVQQH